MSALIVDISNNMYLLLLSMMPVALQGAPLTSHTESLPSLQGSVILAKGEGKSLLNGAIN